MAGKSHVTLSGVSAGDTAQIPVIVTPLQRPLIGIGRQRVPIRFLVHAIGSHERPRTVDTATDVSPMIGIWHLLGVLALIALLIVGVALAGVAALWTVRQSAPTAVTQPPAAAPRRGVPVARRSGLRFDTRSRTRGTRRSWS